MICIADTRFRVGDRRKYQRTRRENHGLESALKSKNDHETKEVNDPGSIAFELQENDAYIQTSWRQREATLVQDNIAYVATSSRQMEATLVQEEHVYATIN